MSAFNFFDTEKKAVELRTKKITTKSGLITYTAKTNKAAFMSGVVDAVIEVTTTSTYSMTITVPDGAYYGQTLWVKFLTEGGTETVDVTTTTGDDATQMTDDGGYWFGIWTGAETGWKTMAYSAT